MQEVLKRGPIETDALLTRAVARSKKMRADLERYIRSTGRTETLAVARNSAKRPGDYLNLVEVQTVKASGPSAPNYAMSACRN